MIIMFMSDQYPIYALKEDARNICSRKSGPQSINITASSVYNKDDARNRLSRGSAEVQTSHLQPISGTPVDVPLPNILSFIPSIFYLPNKSLFEVPLQFIPLMPSGTSKHFLYKVHFRMYLNPKFLKNRCPYRI